MYIICICICILHVYVYVPHISSWNILSMSSENDYNFTKNSNKYFNLCVCMHKHFDTLCHKIIKPLIILEILSYKNFYLKLMVLILFSAPPPSNCDAQRVLDLWTNLLWCSKVLEKNVQQKWSQILKQNQFQYRNKIIKPCFLIFSHVLCTLYFFLIITRKIEILLNKYKKDRIDEMRQTGNNIKFVFQVLGWSRNVVLNYLRNPG